GRGRAGPSCSLPGRAGPTSPCEVPGAESAAVLPAAARRSGVAVLQPAAVESADFDRDGVMVRVSGAGMPPLVWARMLVDASGRSSFIATQHGERRRRPNLGKVALFAHFRGADRLS